MALRRVRPGDAFGVLGSEEKGSVSLTLALGDVFLLIRAAQHNADRIGERGIEAAELTMRRRAA
jgi:hypothetical protein